MQFINGTFLIEFFSNVINIKNKKMLRHALFLIKKNQ